MLQAEVKGKSADRFRVYAKTKLLRSPNAEDYNKYAAAGKPLPPKAKIRYDGEEVVHEDDMGSDTTVSLDAGDATITKVVFYKGPLATEVVVGSVDVNAGGQIEIELIEPAETVLIVDEEPTKEAVIDE